MKLKVKKLYEEARLDPPAYPGDAGYDAYSLDEVCLQPGDHYDFPLGLSLEFDEGYVCLALMKSGLASRYGLDSIGTVIDSSYRGEIHAQISNPTNERVFIKKGMKIVQLVFVPVVQPTLEFVDGLSDSDRGENKFGSSGE